MIFDSYINFFAWFGATVIGTGIGIGIAAVLIWLASKLIDRS